ncbi:MAG: membrane lipoprotein lipid attachment site-containing protein [Bacilli bacterium]|nr:membrane lipoprotein lipid attachment site-containing protein [Bacilli bacterium]
MIKKLIFLFVAVLLLAGCQSKDEYFTKTCTNKKTSKHLVDITEKKVIYNNKDEISNIETTKKYKGKNEQIINYIKKSIEDYNNNLLKNENIKISIIKDEKNIYEIKYIYDVTKMKKEDLRNLDINKNSFKYLKHLKKEGFDCK